MAQLLPRGLAALCRFVPRGIVWTYLYMTIFCILLTFNCVWFKVMGLLDLNLWLASETVVFFIQTILQCSRVVVSKIQSAENFENFPNFRLKIAKNNHLGNNFLQNRPDQRWSKFFVLTPYRFHRGSQKSSCWQPCKIVDWKFSNILFCLFLFWHRCQFHN